MTASVQEATEATYHSDQLTDAPCLSKSIAHLMLTASPAHAWAAHPKLNPDWQPSEDQKFDVGKAAHALLLEGRDPHIIDYRDWKTNAAKELREIARANGDVPLLTHQWEEVRAMCNAVSKQLVALDIDPPLFRDGKSEQTLLWQEGDVWCKARLDWLRDDLTAIDDLKTTARIGGAHPGAWTRNALYAQGADLQAAFYLRGATAVFDTFVPPQFRFVIVETAPPYALTVVQLAPSVMEIANAKAERAIELWRECLTTKTWPAYPTEVVWAELPPWEEQKWLEREAREAA